MTLMELQAEATKRAEIEADDVIAMLLESYRTPRRRIRTAPRSEPSSRPANTSR